MVYAVAMTACQRVGLTNHINVTSCLVEAANQDEATGKGWAIARQRYLAEDGWGEWFVIVGDKFPVPGHINGIPRPERR